jgi:hypothetical protein
MQFFDEDLSLGLTYQVLLLHDSVLIVNPNQVSQHLWTDRA